MGKGGETQEKPVSKKIKKLEVLSDAELRKWSAQYGLKEEKTRSAMLASLVRSTCISYSFFCFLKDEAKKKFLHIFFFHLFSKTLTGTLC